MAGMDGGNMTGSLRRAAVSATIVAALAVAAPGAALAQGGDGFLFSEPRVTLGFESGYGFQRAQSDIFDHVIREFTLERRDFNSPYLGGELAVRVSEQWDLAFNVGYQSSSTQSESRPYVGTDDLPIEQVTDLRMIPAVLSMKYYPRPRGRTIGRFAWVPEKVVPFVGAGVGFVSYRFEQTGEFVDEDTFDIYYDELTTSQSALLARASAGLNVSLGRQFLLTGAARYNWARAPVRDDYSGFGDIDLDGLQLVGGLSVRF